jgi:O-antigen/teichoic acid export membrane protein
LVGTILSQVLRLGSNLVLWRLLYPEAFGVMALVNSLLMALAMFSDVGIGASIVQSRQGCDRAFLDTAWTIQILRGLCIFAATVALAGPMASFYDTPALAAYIRVAGLTAVLQGLLSTRLHVQTRDVRVAAVVRLDLLTQAIATAFTILYAWAVPSVWALVVGGVAGSIVRTVLSHLLLPGEHDRLGWDRASRRQLFVFGRWVFLSTLLAFAAGQSDRLLFGKLITLAQLGAYSLAQALATIPEQILGPLTRSVLFPWLSRAHEDRDGFVKVYRARRGPIVILGGVMATGLVTAGPTLVAVLYGDGARDARWIIPMLAIGGVFMTLRQVYAAALLALGSPKAVAQANGAKLVAMAVLIPCGFWALGFKGGVAGYAASELAAYAASAWAARRAGLLAGAQDAMVIALFAVASSAGLAFHFWARGHGLVAILEVGTLALASVAAWGTLFMLWRRAMARALTPPVVAT